MYEGFMQHALEAAEKWVVTHDEMDAGVRYVEAEAGTGSRYAVLVTPLGHGARLREGGPLLLSVLHPWQAAYPLQYDGSLHMEYVMEKLSGGDRRRNGGDVAALTLTICAALERTPDPGIVSAHGWRMHQ